MPSTQHPPSWHTPPNNCRQRSQMQLGGDLADFAGAIKSASCTVDKMCIWEPGVKLCTRDRIQDDQDLSLNLSFTNNCTFLNIFFSGLEWTGHSFAYVAHLWLLMDVWIWINCTNSLRLRRDFWGVSNYFFYIFQIHRKSRWNAGYTCKARCPCSPRWPQRRQPCSPGSDFCTTPAAGKQTNLNGFSL